MHFLHNDTLIVTMTIGNCQMSKVLVDGRSSVNILYEGALDLMEDTLETARVMISPQTQSHPYGFDVNEIHSPGIISLLVRADPYIVIMKFYVVDVESSHNAILGRPWLHLMKVVPSTYHQLVQYSLRLE